MNKKLPICLTILVSLMLIYAITISSNKVLIECYFYDSCGGCFTDSGPCKPCLVEREIEHHYVELFSKYSLEKYVDFKTYNIMYDPYHLRYQEHVSKGKIETRAFPTFVVGDSYLINEADIDTRLVNEIINRIHPVRKLFYSMRNNKLSSPKFTTVYEMNKVIYFSIPLCQDCNIVKEYFRTADSRLSIINYNLDEAEAMEFFLQYCSTYGLDPKDAVVPLVFINEDALIGSKSIIEYIEEISSSDSVITKVVRNDLDD